MAEPDQSSAGQTLTPNSVGAPLVSVILPCLDEEDVLVETLIRLDRMAGGIADCRFEFIFIDDGSRDGTAEILRKAAAADKRVRVLRFARNFGQQIAVTAGIEVASGDVVVLMDADLQDPPEVVADMIARWRDGYDVVYGTRSSRKADSLGKRATAWMFYSTMNRLSEVPIPADTGDFRLMSRRVVNVLRQMPERHRFIRGMVSWVGFQQTSIQYERPERFAGSTKYPLRKMLRFAMDGILSFSIRPLQISIALGMAAASLALVGIVYALFMRIFTNTWVEGWTALMLAVLFMGGVQLLCLGILGEYVGRIYSEVKRRPLYVVDETLGFDETGRG